MRTASVAHGEGARLAAAVSLVLASAKVRDHVADGDGLLARRPVALAARRIATGWDAAGARRAAAPSASTPPYWSTPWTGRAVSRPSPGPERPC
ncbi:hypothetical protein STENM223S_02713 [Streptomyces tendae]